MRGFFSVWALLAALAAAAEFDFGAYVSRNWAVWKTHPPVMKVNEKEKPATRAKKLAIHRGYVKKYAPHWLKEYAAIDAAFGLAPGTAEQLLFYGYTLPEKGHECTSWVVMPNLTGGKWMMVHKNRDSSATGIALNRLAVPGKHAWTGLGTFGYINPTMGVNECGLAVLMNSGDNNGERNLAGLGTPEIARVLLEECADAAAAAKLLQKMIADGAYSHWDSGSIWFIGDGKQAFVAENSAKHFAIHEVPGGFAIRANAWHYPEMVPYSQNTHKGLMSNHHREFAVRKLLLKKGQVVTQPLVAQASRLREIWEKIYPLCGKRTCAAATFAIHCRHPRELTTAWMAFGPPAHTVFLPVPLTVTEFPLPLMDGTFATGAFRRKAADMMADDAPFVALDAKLRANHEAALLEAEALLDAGKRAEALAVLDAAFRKNWRLVEASSALK